MSAINEHSLEHGILEEVPASRKDTANVKSTALVPLKASKSQSSKSSLPRPDASFLTHLIATVEQFPQTRNLRRAAPADVLFVYRAHQPVKRRTGVSRAQLV